MAETLDTLTRWVVWIILIIFLYVTVNHLLGILSISADRATRRCPNCNRRGRMKRLITFHSTTIFNDRVYNPGSLYHCGGCGLRLKLEQGVWTTDDDEPRPIPAGFETITPVTTRPIQPLPTAPSATFDNEARHTPGSSPTR